MGPSGAGKSTFMDILAMRKSVGSLSGRLLLSGKPATRSFIRQTAYVPQVSHTVASSNTTRVARNYKQGQPHPWNGCAAGDCQPRPAARLSESSDVSSTVTHRL